MASSAPTHRTRKLAFLGRLGDPLHPSIRRSKVQGLIALAIILAATFFYESTGASGLILCPLRMGTGIECAGCGMTRSWCAISRGELGIAMALNPFGPVLYTLAVFKTLFLAVEVKAGRRLYVPVWDWVRGPILGTIAAAMLLFTVYRAWLFFAG